jgi:hypothetical protein
MRAFVTAVAVACGCSALAAYTPAETRARAAAIRETAAAITAECERYAGGDWSAWYRKLLPYRQTIRPAIEQAMKKGELLRAGTQPPIYEKASYGMYLFPPNDDDLSKWAAELAPLNAIAEVSRWLRGQGVDLIVVPAPRMAETYGDLVGAGAPPEKITAPHLRRFVLNLLDRDVEVVDLLPIFLESREGGGEPLYLPADGHWSDAAQRLAAGDIARRLKRYDVVKTALARRPRFTSAATHVAFPGAVFDSLTPGQRDEVKDAVGAMPVTQVMTAEGKPFEEVEASPVIVIGDSFTNYFQLVVRKGTGIDALISRAINLPVANVSMAGATVQPIQEFVRRPSLLAGRRVVVWIFNNSVITYGEAGWKLPPLK